MRQPTFRERAAFQSDEVYGLLPFRFARLHGDSYVLTNEVGEYVVLDRAELVAFVERRLVPGGESYKKLKARHFLLDSTYRSAIDLLALKYRTRSNRTSCFTGLHLFVVTLRCDHSCNYCQVSRRAVDRAEFDMSKAHADKALEFTFRSPSPTIKIEFQGGEPLLNFELVRHVVERAVELNQIHRRRLEFVIASNLSQLSDDVIAFCKNHSIGLSTSLDGPQHLHDAQRPVRGNNSYQMTIAAIQRARAALGPDAVSALMTTTMASLSRVEEIIDEYVRQGFNSIFLRSVSPFGFAARNSLVRHYSVDEWVRFYERGLDYILKINRSGYFMREEYTSILLQKIFDPEGAAYVDLQSPAGIGIGAIAYNYDASVYASDEGRMLAEMGDTSFRLGHLDQDSYESIMMSHSLISTLEDTMPEGVPMCSDCAFLPYCGADPVFHKATRGDVVGHKAFSAFCARQMAVIRSVIRRLEEDPESREILLRWI